MEDEEDAGAGAPQAAEAPPAPNARMPVSYLALCDKGLRDVFRQAMKEEVVQELRARLQEYERVQKDLGGSMYLSPANIVEGDTTDLTAPHKWHVNGHVKVKYRHENGVMMDAFLRISMRKVGDVWKLQHSMTLESPRLDITVKHVGSDDWTPVGLWKHSGFPRDLEADLAIGTDFKHGDQLNMRYIYTDGQSHPVSFDGTEATNCFPLTIRVIGQVG
jgi:hypothetical protein